MFVPRRFIVVALALLLSGGLGAASLLSPPATAKETFTLIEHADTDTVVDLAEEGDTIGDTLAFSNPLYDADNAEQAGTAQGSCVRTAPGSAWECTWTNILEDGSIVVQGPFFDTGGSTLAITGGSGKYSGASGQMQLEPREGGMEHEFTFELN